MMETGLPVIERLVRAGWAVGFYLHSLLLPNDLAMLHQGASPQGWSAGWGFAAGAALLSLLCLALRQRAAARAWLGAFGTFLLLIAPVLGFAPMYFHRFAPVAEQWIYLPGIPILALAGALASRLTLSLRIPVVAAVLAVLAFQTMSRCRELADPLTLWGTEARRNPSSAKAQEWLGVALSSMHRDEEALIPLREAARLDPDSPEAAFNLAAITARTGRITEALNLLSDRENKWPRLADLPAVQGEILLLAGDPARAADSFGKALAIAPTMPKACLGLARAAYLLEQPDLMIPPLQSLLGRDPENSAALGMLGAALASTGHPREAREAFLHALRITPGDPQLIRNLRTLEETALSPGSDTR
jgi:Flp pilus assembly protein TadD